MIADPAVTPDTIPVAPTVAIAVLLLLHTPNGDASDKLMVAPLHTLSAAAVTGSTTGAALTVMSLVASAPPQAVTTE